MGDLDKGVLDKLKTIIGSLENEARDYERGGEISVLYEAEDQALIDIQQAFKDADCMKLDALESKLMSAMDKLDSDIRAEHKCMTGIPMTKMSEPIVGNITFI